MTVVEETTSLKDDDWFFLSLWAMSDYKLDLAYLQYECPYQEVLKIREFLMIERTKEEAYRRDAKLQQGA
jgi:hypothetical protein